MLIEQNIQSIKNYLLQLQNDICKMLEQEDGEKKFHQDIWQRAEGGEGQTRVLTDGPIIEKAGVNFSHVYGENLPAQATQQRPELAGRYFEALGVSVVVHPRNPLAPTSHFNVRFFIATKPNHEPIWWFGGGFDLTPYYGFVEDCVHWHQTAKNACDEFDKNLYQELKANCDNYFYLPHRQETRGIGGLFFDDFNRWDFDTCFRFMQSIGNHYILAYQPILAKRKTLTFDSSQRDFQAYRRGRYVEFNLLYDRGTKFGLQSGGRTESILMSLPPLATWIYDWQPQPGSKEAELYQKFLPPRNWLG